MTNQEADRNTRAGEAAGRHQGRVPDGYRRLLSVFSFTLTDSSLSHLSEAVWRLTNDFRRPKKMQQHLKLKLK